MFEAILSEDQNKESLEKRRLYFILQIVTIINDNYNLSEEPIKSHNTKPENDRIPYAIKMLSGIVCSYLGLIKSKEQYDEENVSGVDYKSYMRKSIENALNRKLFYSLPNIIPEYELHVL